MFFFEMLFYTNIIGFSENLHEPWCLFDHFHPFCLGANVNPAGAKMSLVT